MKWIKKNLVTIILVMIFLTGLGLLLYPTVSDIWNSFHQSQAIAGYSAQVDELDDESYRKMLDAATAYNETLVGESLSLALNEGATDAYNALLDVTGTGIMGYVEIKKINVKMPIYHGTDEGVLQVGAGHLAGTSLPVGGKSTHSVICGHRGVPSAKLFTDLDRMEEGDTFTINVLNETLTYEVDQVLIVEPDDITALEIEKGQDLCTLMTCTPYGINTQRLLIRGHRVANAEDTPVTADASVIRPYKVAIILTVPLLIAVLATTVIYRKKTGRQYSRDCLPPY
jgi:sortase A